MIGNKIAGKITSVGKPKNKGKEKDNETDKTQEIHVPTEKCHKVIDDLRWNTKNLLDNTLETAGERVPKFTTKKWVVVHD